MRALLDLFAYDRRLADDELARLRLAAAIRPGCPRDFPVDVPLAQASGIDAFTIDDKLLRRLPHETLILHGREGRVIPMSNSLRLFELIDNSQLHIFGRCGHWVQIEHADKFNRLTEDFLHPRAR